MKRFMRSGKEGGALKGRGGGGSSVAQAAIAPTVDLATTQTTPTQAATHTATSQIQRHTIALQATKLAAAKQVAANQAVGKQVAANQTTAKQAAANQGVAKQTTVKEAVAQQVTINQAATKEVAVQQIANEAAAKHEALRHEVERLQQDKQATEAHAGPQGAQVQAEEQMLDPAHSRKTELILHEVWFSKPIVAGGVTDSFKAHYNHPYTCWTEVPQHVKERWFLEFQRHFTWKLEHADMVRRDYEMKCVQRLKDNVNKVSKKPLHKPVSWMSETVRAELVRKRQHPDFIKRSTNAKKNRYSNQSEDAFDPGHRQGSISTVELAERLAAKKNGVLPLAADVYEKTHGFEMPDGETILVGDKPNKTMAEYAEKLVEYKNKGVVKAPDDVFLEVVGGVKKGKVYGLGNASTMFFKESTHNVSLISQLSSQLEECKKLVEESRKTAEDSLGVARANQEAYEKGLSEWKKEKDSCQQI